MAEEQGALGMKVGPGSRLLLSLDAGTRYSSNYYYQEQNEESSIGLIVRPAALLLKDLGSLHYQIGASAEAAAFDLDGDADDYVDGKLNADFTWSPLTRHGFAGGVHWTFDHDPLGTQRTEAVPGLANRDLDRWEQRGGNVVYRFGAPEATINLEAALSAFDREYQTNRASTQFLDHDHSAIRGTVFYKVSPKTRLLAEVVRGEIDYDVTATGFPSRAGDLTRYRVGAEWQATGKTSGKLKIGRLERDFDAANQESLDELDWEATITWEPRARDRISFATGRETQESYINAARIIDEKFYRVSWVHDWTSMLQSRVTYEFDDLEFQGIGRQDDRERLSLGLDFAPNRNWELYTDFSLLERDSTFPNRDFDTTFISAGIRLSY